MAEKLQVLLLNWRYFDTQIQISQKLLAWFFLSRSESAAFYLWNIMTTNKCSIFFFLLESWCPVKAKTRWWKWHIQSLNHTLVQLYLLHPSSKGLIQRVFNGDGILGKVSFFSSKYYLSYYWQSEYWQSESWQSEKKTGNVVINLSWSPFSNS